MRTAAILLVVVGLPLMADAHHSFVNRFDRKSTGEIEGEITELLWRNPHTYMTVRSQGSKGDPVDWQIETGSLSLLRRLGIEGAMKVGDRIKIAGYPPTSEKHEMYAQHILLPDGTELLLDTGLTAYWGGRTSGDKSLLAIRQGDPSRPDLGVFRVWSFIRSGPRLFPEAVDPTFNVQSYPMTDAARATLASFDIEKSRPTGNCAPKGMPTLMEQPYPIELVKRDDGNIVLRIEEYDLERVIYMRADSAPKNPPRSLLGQSIGRWDGRTLVVKTTRVSWPYFSQVGIPQSDAAELVERFTPTEDGSRMDYELTVTDPKTFTKPVTLHMYWIWVPGIEILPFNCKEREP